MCVSHTALNIERQKMKQKLSLRCHVYSSLCLFVSLYSSQQWTEVSCKKNCVEDRGANRGSLWGFLNSKSFHANEFSKLSCFLKEFHLNSQAKALGRTSLQICRKFYRFFLFSNVLFLSNQKFVHVQGLSKSFKDPLL